MRDLTQHFTTRAANIIESLLGYPVTKVASSDTSPITEQSYNTQGQVKPLYHINSEHPLLTRAKQRHDLLAIKRQQNIEAILTTAMEFCPDVASNKQPDADWVEHFIALCEDTSNSSMQALWAKILTGETLSPGTFSIKSLQTLKHMTQRLLHDIEQKLEKRLRVNYLLDTEMNTITEKLEFLINDFFFEDLINSIYKKIDPHPTFKKVEFKVTFGADKPCLNILVSDSEGKMISPILYFSAAQTNILSLSVFLANALHAKDDKDIPIDAILIDDPIQSMDSINILSMIDLLRSICLQFDKQLIISTHDENFFGLLQRKIPADIFGSKFLQLEKFGVVKPVEPICN